MMNNFFTLLILAVSVTAQWGGSGGGYGKSYGTPAAAPAGDCVTMTSTIRHVKTVMADCCGGAAATAYGAMGSATPNANDDASSPWGSNGTSTGWSNSTSSSSNGSSKNGTTSNSRPIPDQDGTKCDADSQNGADCSVASCCGSFECDFTTLKCVPAGSIPIPANNGTNGTSSGGNSNTVNLFDNNANNPDNSEQGEAAPPGS